MLEQSMKYASERWLSTIAICLGLVSAVQAEVTIFSEDASQASGAVTSETEGVVQTAAGSMRSPAALFPEDPPGLVVNGPEVGAAHVGDPSGSASIEAVQAQFPQSPSAAPPQFTGRSQPMFPNAQVPSDANVGFANMAQLDQILWRVGNTAMDQYGLNNGYTSLNAFVPLFVESDTALLWFNPRVNLNNQSYGVVNLGLGQRWYSPRQNRVWGASLWWDWDNGHIQKFQQLGGSFESIGQYLSWRGNFTVPTGKKDAIFNVRNVSSTFSGSSISLLQTFSTQSAYQQYDTEFAVPMPGLGRYGFDLGLGAYYLTSNNSGDATGVSVRTQAQITEDFWLSGTYTYDNVFKSLFSLNFEYTVGDGKPARWFRRNPVSSYLTQSVIRRYRVPVHNTSGSRTVLATSGGTVLRIAFIDPNQTVNGTGTLENPYDSLADYSADAPGTYDAVYVYANTTAGNAADHNLNTSITLFDDQKLIGEGATNSITTDLGVIPLPVSLNGPPTISNSANTALPVITLADNNEVLGFIIDASNSELGSAAAIDGSAGISGFDIHNNTIQNFVNGILITSNPTGTARGVIANNTLIGTNQATNQFPSLAGISVTQSNTGTLNLLVANNVISNIDEDANGNGTLNDETTTGIDQDFDGIIDADEDLNGNGLQDGVGIYVLAEKGTINANNYTSLTNPTGILNNTITNSAAGIDVTVRADAGSTAQINLAFNDNLATGLTAPPSTNPNQEGGFAFRLTSDNVNGSTNNVMNLVSFQDNATETVVGGARTSTLNEGNGTIFTIQNNGKFQFNGASLGIATIFGNDFGGNAGTGLLFNIVDSVVAIDSLNGLSVTGNNGDGLAVNVTRSSALTTSSLTVNDPIVNATITGNAGNGLIVTADNGATVNMRFGQLNASGTTTGNTFNNNGTGLTGGSGLVLNALNTDGFGPGIFNTSLVGNSFQGNNGNGAVLNANGGTIDLSNPALITLSDGVTTVASAGVVGIGTAVSSTQNFSNNTMNGLAILSTNGGSVNVPFMNGNFFNNNTGENTGPDPLNPTTNTGAGLFIGSDQSVLNPTASTITILTASNNQFNRTAAGTTGILFDTKNVTTSISLGGNQFIGNATSAFGIGGTIDDGGLTMNMVTGGTAAANTFTTNVGAHVGLIFEGASNNHINIDNGTFTGALTDTDTTDDFNGDGIALIVRDTAQLDGSVTDSTLSTNQGDGLKLAITGNNVAGNAPQGASSAINNFLIDGNTFTRNGFTTPTSTTTTSNNIAFGSGITVQRTGRGQVVGMRITDNTSTSNARSGLFILGGNAITSNLPNGPDDYYIGQNTFTANRDGIEFEMLADAGVNADIDQNLIVNNTDNGIWAWERVNAAGDARALTGTWQRNTIRRNDNDGINISTNAGDPFFAIPDGLLIGDATISPLGTVTALGNLITQNGRDGIDITGGGLYTIGNNTITQNGLLTQNTDPNNGSTIDNYYLGTAGINISGPYFENGTVAGVIFITDTTHYYQTVNVVSNLITNNLGNGITWISEPGTDSVNLRMNNLLTVNDNLIGKNDGRGINMLIRPGDADITDSDNSDPSTDRIASLIDTGGSSFTWANGGAIRGTAVINDNQIFDNKQEGIYVVGTNSNDQSAAVTSETLLQMTGLVTTRYFLDLTVTNNEITGNGNEVIDFPATGLVLRVGTTDGGYGPTFAGGFASTGFGGMIVDIENNYFTGNEGDDVLAHSFTSTVTPGTGTTWSTTQYNTAGYQSDPLARLDLTFSNNSFDSVTFNNGDTTITDTINSTGGTVAGNPGAYYNDSDGTFKSKTVNNTNPTQGGPFRAGNRSRNAQRQASRSTPGGILNPQGFPPASDTFLYPGLGASTFRISSASTGNTFNDIAHTPAVIPGLFALDVDPYSDWTDARGVPMTVFVNSFGELPFGWGQF
jgi:hypothetical protein